MNHKPLAFLWSVDLDIPSPSEKTADVDRLLDTLSKVGLTDVKIPLQVMRRLPRELRKNNYRLHLAIGFYGDSLQILDVSREILYGLAVDIGSTNIECSLINLVSGDKIDETSIENPQIRFGNDVLARVQRAMIGESSLLHQTLLEGLNTLVNMVCTRNNISGEDILGVSIAGNTIMSHFFLGLDVTNIPLSPHIPAVNRSLFLSAEQIGLSVHKNAVVYIFPNAGSYVGGDIISGMISSGIYKEDQPSLFIDVGTNVEITLGCRDWIMVGAGAAGPALEGGVALIGKKADRGTISEVRIDRLSKKIELNVISGGEPSGICGSGLIDLISEMFSANIIDQAGKFTGLGSGIIEKDGEKVYQLYKTDTRELNLREAEIKNFLLSKAAMFSFLYVFVRSVGLTFSDIRKIFIGGALGCNINLEKAITIGMLPDMPRERFVSLGNSSLRGAELVLLNRDLTIEIEGMIPMITYREMSEDVELMNVFAGALFIPHTDCSLLTN
ncbi:MAG TPA: [Fe-S]-binding protein [Nitrospiraceae bacterium]|jgi:uncharacterized 2Fe-2S/4Fe-4S cluster protein (DUF4445 family)|nr:[Fe-S]-binding protein [Nitrospiraceae bacterium]